MSATIIQVSLDELRALLREESARSQPAALPEILTRADCAKLLQVHASVVTKYVNNEGLPSHFVGGEYRFVRSEVLAWVASKPTKGAA